MSFDDNGEEGPGIREFLGEYWAATPGCYVGAAVAVVGALLAVAGWFLGRGTVFGVGTGAFVLGVLLAVVRCRLTGRQQQYLDRAEQERLEIRAYRSFLADVAAERRGKETGPSDADGEEEGMGDDAGPDSPVGTRGTGSGPPPLWELESRLERAERELLEARHAVYRRDYSSFLSLFYDASRQEILLYDLLDARSGAWAFGLGSGGFSGAPESAGESGAPDGSGSGAESGGTPEPGAGPEPHRRRNLSRRIRSFAEESLPEARLGLVRTYLGEEGEMPSPWELYYAVRVLHEWNVGRYERALQVKRFLRGGILTLVVLVVGLAAVLSTAFPGGFLAGGNGTSEVVTNDAFLVLILLAGGLGAVFSMLLRSFGEFYTLTTDPSVPEPVFMMEALLARTLFGSVSAVILFFIAQSGFGEAVLASSLLDSPLSLLLLGFVSGVSERFVRRSLGELVGRIGDEGASDDRSPEAGSGGDGPPETRRESRAGPVSGARRTGERGVDDRLATGAEEGPDRGASSGATGGPADDDRGIEGTDETEESGEAGGAGDSPDDRR